MLVVDGYPLFFVDSSKLPKCNILISRAGLSFSLLLEQENSTTSLYCSV